jgi:hypothetical protein
MKGALFLAVGTVTAFSLAQAGADGAVNQGPNADYVVVRSFDVNIRTGPGIDRVVITQAEKGDIFAYVGETEGWVEIRMFSEEPRYISRSHVYPLTASQIVPGHNLALPADSTCQALYAAIQWATDRAELEATEILPASVDAQRHATLSRILQDRLLMEFFHEHGVQVVMYEALIEEAGAQGW